MVQTDFVGRCVPLSSILRSCRAEGFNIGHGGPTCPVKILKLPKYSIAIVDAPQYLFGTTVLGDMRAFEMFGHGEPSAGCRDWGDSQVGIKATRNTKRRDNKLHEHAQVTQRRTQNSGSELSGPGHEGISGNG